MRPDSFWPSLSPIDIDAFRTEHAASALQRFRYEQSDTTRTPLTSRLDLAAIKTFGSYERGRSSHSDSGNSVRRVLEMGLELEIRVGFALTTSQWDINVNLRRHVPPLEHPLQALEASRYPVDLSALVRTAAPLAIRSVSAQIDFPCSMSALTSRLEPVKLVSAYYCGNLDLSMTRKLNDVRARA
jgi:hypothetical protein